MDKKTRRRLEKLADRGVLPSHIGFLEEDHSDDYMESGTDVDDKGVVMVYDKDGAYELDDLELENVPKAVLS